MHQLPRRIVLSPTERRLLQKLVRQTTAPYPSVQRARMVLLRAQGYGLKEIAARVDYTRQHVAHWLRQWQAAGIEGLLHGASLSTTYTQRRAEPPATPAELRERICQALARLRREPRVLHCRELARRVHEPNVVHVNRQCIRMAHEGRLRWTEPGMYALREERV